MFNTVFDEELDGLQLPHLVYITTNVPELGWRGMFLIGILPALLIVYLRASRLRRPRVLLLTSLLMMTVGAQ